VRTVGRLVGISNGNAQFSGSFANMCASADLKQGRLLDAIDEFATTHGLDAEIGAVHRPRPTDVGTPINTIDLSSIRTVVWATGFRPNYPWLESTLLDHRGAIVHDGGVMNAEGMYVLGLPFGRRRKSSFIDGVGPDAIELTEHLASHLDRLAAPALR
jgi:putative flavoprotein involved in K+ transport